MAKKTDKTKDGFEEWGGYMEAKKSKLEQQFHLEAKSERNNVKSNIFEGISIFVNGYTIPTSDELRILMMEHGGTYHHYYRTNKTTFMIATNLPLCKEKLHNSIVIIKPQWILDSIQAGKKLDHKSYLLRNSTNEIANFPQTKGVHKTAKDENFLDEFYENSRLHHISTMGTTFKKYVQNLRQKTNKQFEGLERLKKLSTCSYNEQMDDSRIIMHIDMDCFFVSVGIKNRPDLTGFPVAVTHARNNNVKKREGVDRKAEFEIYMKRFKDNDNNVSPEKRSFFDIGENDSMAEIASCNYEARKFGVKNGMLLGQAMKLCQNLKTIPYDFDGYTQVSYKLYDHVSSFTEDIEAVSCDEMYVDCTDLLKNNISMDANTFATILRGEIYDLTGCPCSTGFGPNRLLARLATKLAKPNGQFVVKEEDVSEFMRKFKVSDLPGVGFSISSKLSSMGINTCEDMQNTCLSKLQTTFGQKTGLMLHKSCFGKDDKSLTFDQKRKSVSADVNYGIRFEYLSEAETFLKNLSVEVENRLCSINMKGKCITLKLMIKAKGAPAESSKFLGHGACDYFTKSSSLAIPTCDSNVISREVIKILKNSNLDPKDLRGIGIQVSKLEYDENKNKTSIERFLQPNLQKKEEKKEPITTAVISVESKKRIGKTRTPKKGPMDIFLEKSRLPVKSLDDSFINDIPEHLRNEILNSDPRPRTNRYGDLSLSKIDPDFLDALSPELRNEVVSDISEIVNNTYSSFNRDPDEVYGIIKQGQVVKLDPNLPISEIKTAVREWINTQEYPELCDRNMITDFLQQLIFNRNIEQLSIILRFMHRLIERSRKQQWIDTYSKIVNDVQEVMNTVYGNPLSVDVF